MRGGGGGRGRGEGGPGEHLLDVVMFQLRRADEPHLVKVIEAFGRYVRIGQAGHMVRAEWPFALSRCGHRETEERRAGGGEGGQHSSFPRQACFFILPSSLVLKCDRLHAITSPLMEQTGIQSCPMSYDS